MGLAGEWLGKQLAIGTESNTGLSYSVPSSVLGENSALRVMVIKLGLHRF